MAGQQSEEVIKMEIPKSVIKSIEDGKHPGTIKKVEYRMDPYDYTDVVVLLEDVDVEVKYGCPSKISFDEEGNPASKLAKLMVACEVMGDESGDPDKLTGLKVNVMTLNETNKAGTFARIVDGSIKLRKDK